MGYHHCCSLTLGLTSFLIISFSTADDAAIMAKLSKSISPTPFTWDRNDFCSWNGITCDIDNYGSLGRLVIRINLSHRSLTGTLPSDLNSLRNLRTLALQGNSLSAPLPTLSNLAFLEQVILDSNNFTSIPSDLFYGLTSLRSFSISDNLQLSPWSLPNNPIDSTNLQSFQANQANIYGTIPDIFYSFPNLQNLSLSYNNLTGSLPASFRGSRIQNFRLNNQIQGLSGTLDVLSSMTQISQVWLEGNVFTGAIPEMLISLPDLQLLDVSNNNLFGLVPVFPTRVKFSSDNNLLLGKLITNKTINPTDSSNGSAGLVIGIVISSVIFVIGVVLFVSYKCYRVSPSKLQSEISVDHSEIPSSESGNVMMISIQMLQQATDDFSDDKVLGKGGFGVVYKGELDDGTKIAVKRRKSGVNATKWMNEFLAFPLLFYLAPEYSATGRATSKVDVYSFGVVLMQLITGRKALDKTMPYESCQLATWFRRVPVTKENMVKYVDKALDTNDNETLESIFKVAELAKHCTAVEPFHRPDMGYVGSVLRLLFEQWTPLSQEQEKTYYRRHVSLPLALQADEDTSSSLDIFQPNSF